MKHLQSLIQARDNNYLWPTIADAVDTFLRRRACNSDSYERIWRLIHIWESLEVTLATASISKMVGERNANDPVLRKCREYFYGMSWNQVDREFRYSQGAVDGSIDQWINILNEISKDETLVSSNCKGFLKAIYDFLNADKINLRKLGQAWSKACDVPPEILQRDVFVTKLAIRNINTFRNRFAHVPFPHDRLSELAEALEDVTAQLFSIEPLPSKHFEKSVGNSNPLTGAFCSGDNLIRGTIHQFTEQNVGSPSFKFPSYHSSNDKFEESIWDSAQLIFIDEMARSHIIAKAKSEANSIEYIRYKAEANAVMIRSSKIEELIIKPSSSEYQTEDDKKAAEKIKGDTEITFEQAITANRDGNYDIAIRFFEKLKKKEPNYHIAWLNLGYAQREKAVRFVDNPEQAIQLLTESTSNLIYATNHIDKEYQARAYYELSKTYYQLAKKDYKTSENFGKAEEAALEAATRSSDPKYQTWFEHIEQYV